MRPTTPIHRPQRDFPAWQGPARRRAQFSLAIFARSHSIPRIPPPAVFNQLTILAPGLLGASLGQAAKANGLAARVVVWARRVEARLEAAEQPWCDSVGDTPEEAARGADLVVVCSPVETIVDLVARVAPALRPEAVVTDVGSTKSLICREARGATAGGPSFVGSHPMAGSEKSGLAHARANLFQGRACFVTPLPETPVRAVKAVVGFWKALDMEVATLSPEAHDEIVANVSHLPHVVASALASHLGHLPSEWARFSGPGLADTTRIASGSARLWLSILDQNRDEVMRALNGFEGELQRFKSALANENRWALLHLLERGKVFRDGLRPDID